MKGYHEYREAITLCLRSAAICQHCAASCTQETDVNRMADCIQLDMECETICLATAKMLSLGSRHVQGNAASTKMNIAANVQLYVRNVPTLAGG